MDATPRTLGQEIGLCRPTGLRLESLEKHLGMAHQSKLVLGGMAVGKDYSPEAMENKISGCYRNGSYTPRFKLVYHDPDSVVLQSHFD